MSEVNNDCSNEHLFSTHQHNLANEIRTRLEKELPDRKCNVYLATDKRGVNELYLAYGCGVWGSASRVLVFEDTIVFYPYTSVARTAVFSLHHKDQWLTPIKTFGATQLHYGCTDLITGLMNYIEHAAPYFININKVFGEYGKR